MHLGLISSKRKVFVPVNWPLVNLPWTFLLLHHEGFELTSPICPWFLHEFQMSAVHCGSLNCCHSWDVVSGRKPVVTRVSIICLPKNCKFNNFFFLDKFAEQHEFLTERELNRKLTSFLCAFKFRHFANRKSRMSFIHFCLKQAID